MDKETATRIFEENKERYFSEWKRFLEFKSISTNPDFDLDCRRCAEWLSDHLTKIGLQSELWETPQKPVVYAQSLGTKGAPTVVFYGHYDVQPVDPVELWKSDPFSPEFRGERLYARGAQDNKGQLFYVVKAIETLKKLNQLNCNLKVLIEGEEEFGSRGITEMLPKWEDKIQGDIVLVCDTGGIKAGVPTITMGLRGIIRLNIVLDGLRTDLHSGVHGGVVKNPATEIARLVASLHNADGSIAVKGYYEGIQEFSKEDLSLANASSVPTEWYEKLVGVPPMGGEKGKSFVERRGFRPTIEINGIHSGYGGPGSKTIIPSSAEAKISSRVVAGQDPKKCMRLLIEHLKMHAPEGLKMSIRDTNEDGEGFALSSDSKLVSAAREVLDQIGDEKTAFLWEGASIPLVASLRKVTGGEPLLVGFGLEEDNIHAPNESFSIQQFKMGYLFATMFLGMVSSSGAIPIR